jgi:four helix bundle protein
MDGEIKNFYDLDAWKKGHVLVLNIYVITKEFPHDEVYGITSQLRRAVSSITANIAEGFARYHFKDKIWFYYNSRGSVAEMQNFLLLARDLGYIDNRTCKDFGEKSVDVEKLINGLIRFIEQQKH